MIIEEHPADTLYRIKSLLALYMSVDWDRPMVGAIEGRHVLLDEMASALGYVHAVVESGQLEAFEGVEGKS